MSSPKFFVGFCSSSSGDNRTEQDGSMKVNSNRLIFSLLSASVGLTRILLPLALFLASVILLPAQNVVLTGAIGGRVTDHAGAVIPGASILVRDLATGRQQSAVTNH